jgi:AcrR family transcriptional regulator
MVLENPQSPVVSKEPVQERSKKTKRNILEAAQQVFSDLGYENATTHHIAQQAGLSIGGVYAHFKSKEEIFLVVLEERSKTAYAKTMECVGHIRSEKLNIEEGLDYFFAMLYSLHTKYGKLNLEMNRFVTMNQKAAQIHDYWEREEERVIMEWLRENPDRVVTERLQAAIIVIGRATHAVFHYLYSNSNTVDEKEILSQLVTMFKCYLLKRG